MLCSVLEQTPACCLMELGTANGGRGRNLKLFVLKFKSLFSTSISSFTSLCLELPSKRTIKTIFSLVTFLSSTEISLRWGNRRKMVFVNYKCYPVISPVCFAADFQVGFQLAYLFRIGKLSGAAMMCLPHLSSPSKGVWFIPYCNFFESRYLSANSASMKECQISIPHSLFIFEKWMLSSYSIFI